MCARVYAGVRMSIQVLIRDTIRSSIAIHAPYDAPHVRHPFAIDTQLKRNTCEIVAPEMFHQTISAILLRICSFFRTPYERNGIADQWNRVTHGPRTGTVRYEKYLRFPFGARTMSARASHGAPMESCELFNQNKSMQTCQAFRCP